MPRDLPIGNGSLLINSDFVYQIRDVYWPHVGQENHSTGHPFHFGAWVDGHFRWVHQEGWQRSLDYNQDTLVTYVNLENDDLKLRLVCEDAVDFHENLFLRKITAYNLSDHDREIRLFFSHDFHISCTEVGDTAYYEPERHALFHYKGKRWFLINTCKLIEDRFEYGLDQWAAGLKEVDGKEGAWRDAEDGNLSGNPVAQGSVDSCAALHLNVPANGNAEGWYWIAAGCDFIEVTRLNRMVRQRTPASFLERTRNYWKLWASKEPENAKELPADILELYKRSLLILRTQIDNNGAVIAGTDFDITSFARDTYAYMWPRDGSMITAALIEAGYSEVSRKFFNFCSEAITPEGYLLHKYNPDGSLASSWHPWYHDGSKQLPVQEDETALVLWALWRHFEKYRDVEFIKPLFRRLIVRGADWLQIYRDDSDGLPHCSWDLWEERRGILSWTVAAAWAGLKAAANFSTAFGEAALALKYLEAADALQAGAEKYLWRPEQGRFARMINRAPGNKWTIDLTIDTSLFGLWYFGMFTPDDLRIVSTMNSIREKLWVKTDIGGLARYEGDSYQKVSNATGNVPGNPWFISPLWFAEWQIAIAKSLDDLKLALEILNLTVKHALKSGVMAEQINPYDHSPLSVSPLTWSHSTLVITVLEYLKKLSLLKT